MNCLICDSICSSFEDAKEGIVYYECDSCTLIMKSKENLSSFVEQKKRYDLHQNSSDSIGYRDYFQRFIDFVLPLKHYPQNGLDFGCGKSTLLADMLTQNSIPTDFYDPIYHPNKIYKSNSYDLILSIEVFEHLHNPKEVFSILIEHLNIDGYIAIQTAFRPDTKEEFLKWYYRLDPTHVIFFSYKSLDILASKYGMRVIRDDRKQMVLMERE